MPKPISVEIKRTCCDMKKDGLDYRQIYDQYFKHQFDKPQAFESFVVSMRRWSKKTFPDEPTLYSGTYDGFIAHDATVQVSKTGEIVQAWIKQTASEVDSAEFIEAIKENVIPYEHKPVVRKDSKWMLEIPLFDMHWGIAFMDYYKKMLDEILDIIAQHHWDKIIIPFGQDFFHNDSISNGQTTKGTIIEKVDMKKAVKEGQLFIYSIIDAAISHANEVHVIYSPGNHDRSMSWMFMQILLERYGPDIVDDSLAYKKVVKYGSNAIMFTHGDSKRATPNNLAHIFAITFPSEFANSEIREVHAGHLHTEFDTDVFGVMVRRLSSANKTDEWSDKEDFIGSHKRFMLFEWSLEKLKSINYI